MLTWPPDVARVSHFFFALIVFMTCIIQDIQCLCIFILKKVLTGILRISSIKPDDGQVAQGDTQNACFHGILQRAYDIRCAAQALALPA